MIRLGSVNVEIGDAFTITTFDDGERLTALHAEQGGQADTAREYGFASAFELNRTHDLMHSLAATWMGLPHSPTLHAVAHGQTYEHWREEEAFVLAAQRYARVLGVDLVALARRMG